MKLPRDLSGAQLIKLLSVYGYKIVVQKGSHIKVTTQQNGEHHLAIPNHESLKIGTLNAILNETAKHFDLSKEEVMNKLFVK
jgi:predicted RNA binding protein YcfA (HicA-like mRNA interferase family)